MNRLCDAVSIIILESVPYNTSKHLGFGMREEKRRGREMNLRSDGCERSAVEEGKRAQRKSAHAHTANKSSKKYVSFTVQFKRNVFFTPRRTHFFLLLELLVRIIVVLSFSFCPAPL